MPHYSVANGNGHVAHIVNGVSAPNVELLEQLGPDLDDESFRDIGEEEEDDDEGDDGDENENENEGVGVDYSEDEDEESVLDGSEEGGDSELHARLPGPSFGDINLNN